MTNKIMVTVMVVMVMMMMMMIKQIHGDHNDDVASVDDNQTNIGYVD